MKITPIAKIRASQEIVDQILANIMAGNWAPGSKLPSENELGQLFSVSRVPVREALKKLHSYDLPCIVAYPVAQGSPAFLQWVADETAATGNPGD